jgi:transcriptional regulator with XRE-family HTH domain
MTAAHGRTSKTRLAPGALLHYSGQHGQASPHSERTHVYGADLQVTDSTRKLDQRGIPHRAAAGTAAALSLDGGTRPAQEADQSVGIAGFGARLRKIRQDRGLTLAQLAEATQLSTSFLSLLENDKSDISLGRLARIIEALDVQYKDLIYTGEPAEESSEILVRADQRRSLRDEVGIHTEFMARSVMSGAEHIMMTFDPGAIANPGSYRNYHPMPGESFYLVLEGELLVEFERGGPVILRGGDSLSLLHDNFKGARNIAPTPTVVFVAAHRYSPTTDSDESE